MNTLRGGLVAGLISAGMLLDVAGDSPKVSEANRETVRIMKTIKIPPPYTPVYQPPAGSQYVPPARVTPDSLPKATSVAASNTNLTGTNVWVVDKTSQTSAPVIIPAKEKAPEVVKPK